MRYRRASWIVRFGLIALIAGQLGGCAAARDVTRGAGTAIGVVGALALLIAIDPNCDPDEDICANDEPYYEEDTLEARAALAAGGGAAVLLGSGLVAVAKAPKKRKRRPPPAPQPPPVAAPANAPEDARSRALRELIEKRCVPEGGIDLRVPAHPGDPRTPPRECEASGPARAPDSPDAPDGLAGPDSDSPAR
jgi:hypothetical protein